MTIDKESLLALAKEMAMDVANNADVAPQLCFPHIYLGLQKMSNLIAAAPIVQQPLVILTWQERRTDWMNRHRDKREGPPSNDPFTLAEIADLRAARTVAAYRPTANAAAHREDK